MPFHRSFYKRNLINFQFSSFYTVWIVIIHSLSRFKNHSVLSHARYTSHIRSQEHLCFLMHWQELALALYSRRSLSFALKNRRSVLFSRAFTLLVVNVKNHSVQLSCCTLLRLGIHYVIHHSHRRLYQLPPVINSFFVPH